jgi:hypothetical protein
MAETAISALAIIIALLAFAVSGLTFWFEWQKPFGLICTILGEVIYPPTRDGTPFSIILPLALRNVGARGGGMEAAAIILVNASSTGSCKSLS